MKAFLFLIGTFAMWTSVKGQIFELVKDADYQNIVFITDSILKVDSNDCFARGTRANALYHLSRYAEAIDGINFTLDNCKQFDTETFTMRARCYQKMKDYRAAIKDFTKAISLAGADYNTGNACFQIGFCYAELGEYEAAIDWYTKATAREPTEGINYYNRALIYHKVKNNKAACNDLKQAVLLGLKSAQSILDQLCK